jgi:hypothetical protein
MEGANDMSGASSQQGNTKKRPTALASQEEPRQKCFVTDLRTFDVLLGKGRIASIELRGEALLAL